MPQNYPKRIDDKRINQATRDKVSVFMNNVLRGVVMPKITQFRKSERIVDGYREEIKKSRNPLLVLRWWWCLRVVGYGYMIYLAVATVLTGSRSMAFNLVMDLVGSAALHEVEDKQANRSERRREKRGRK